MPKRIHGRAIIDPAATMFPGDREYVEEDHHRRFRPFRETNRAGLDRTLATTAVFIAYIAGSRPRFPPLRSTSSLPNHTSELAVSSSFRSPISPARSVAIAAVP
ncbi:hypothetical protein D1007_32522 [Hordeum vulgare]|nr:hypothetical protein D1007_32522 [Hordeum vulgare]